MSGFRDEPDGAGEPIAQPHDAPERAVELPDVETDAERDPADDERHHAADEAHRPQDVLAADDRGHADEPEQDRHHDRDPGEAQPLEDRSLLALRVRLDVRQLDRPLRGVVGLGDGFAGAVGLVANPLIRRTV